ncbi:MAG: YqgE/AlgH family protein [Burkholderiales bacterium]
MMNLTNHFLVAMPSVAQDVFAGSVVYITEHSLENGAIGVIVNKPLGKTLKNVFQDVDLTEYNPNWANRQLYLGGPINAENGFVLHRTMSADGKLFELTNNRSVLDEIAQSQFKDNLFISIGYSAWASLQAEAEIRQNDWLVVKADAGLIFEVDPAYRYEEAMRLLGIRNISQLYFSGDIFA